MGKLLGGGKAAKTVIDRSAYDLTKAADKYSANADQQYQDAIKRQQFANTANQALIQQLQAQTNGTAPSIAEAQLRSTTNRNLAQTMAAAAAQRGVNPALQQRQLMQQRAASNRDVAEQGAALRLQEQQQNQNLLANQLNNAQSGSDNLAMNSSNAGFGYQQNAKQLAAQGEGLQAQLNNQTTMQNQAAENSMFGNLTGAAAKLGAGFLGGGGAAAGGASNVMGAGRQLPAGFMMAAHGALVNGPEVTPEDSLENDVVPAKLSAGEMVVPESVVAKGPKAIKSFAELLLEKNVNSKKPNSDYSAVVAAKKRK